MTVVDQILREHPRARREALIPVLQDVQKSVGYLSEAAVMRIADHLCLPTSKIYGVATFYNQFRFQAPGRHQIQVCRGTACHVKRSRAVLEALQKELKINPGQTAGDGIFSLETVACLGACGLAPVICIDGEFYAQVKPQEVGRILRTHQKKAAAEAKAEA